MRALEILLCSYGIWVRLPPCCAWLLCLISNLAFNLFTPTILNCSPLFLDCLRVILDAWNILTHSLYSGKFWEKIHHMLLICGVVPEFLFIHSFIYHSTWGRILSGRHPTFSGCLTSGILSDQRPTFSGCLTSRILSADIPPSPDVSHPKFYPPTFHILLMSHIWNSIRRHSIFSRCLTSGTLSAAIPSSPDVSHLEICPSTFHLLRIFHIWRPTPDGREGWFNFPGEHPQPTIQIPYSHFLYLFFKFKLLNGFPISKPFR